MKILITGANGFIGNHVVEQTLAAGHQVVALVRSKIPDSWENRPNLQIVFCDLSAEQLPDLQAQKLDVIIHLAAEMKSNSLSLEDMLIATRKIVQLAITAQISKFILVSSFSAIDYLSAKAHTTIDENNLAASYFEKMSKYAAFKSAQEAVCKSFAEQGGSLVVLRPGLVYDASKLQPFHAGIIKGKLQILVDHTGYVPVVEINSVASAILQATEIALTGTHIFHLLDDQLPTQRQYLEVLKRQHEINANAITLPWQILSRISFLLYRLTAIINKTDKLPEVFLPHAFSARLKPYHFSNAKAKELLGWQPHVFNDGK